MIGLDTNVLVRYVVQDDNAAFAVAARVMDQLSEESPGFITQVTLAEFYWVLSRSYHYPRDTCLAAVSQLVSTRSLEFDDGEGVVRALTLAEAGADFPDALIEAAMELFGVTETVTFDRRAARALGWKLLTD
ncbi:PIN domain-containing protein [Ornithinimicrobium faecis]|uniref:Type II toxin-antitoxin system VapC family toxin n=1 Tax=Ornithinimicrobium faecis TaxID=2934158 RepID=A0ABY4YX70_9MICO|nr:MULTISPECIES: type II toxin-antitoxin system VapC family toxin [unclassified Ornithinimicrobium]USQ81367.1 type II toxin-antitoxin system VapC family toxin [Ornithinimicrobium sp. HY1793]